MFSMQQISGKKITDVLVGSFTFLDYNFTANLEGLLDDIAEGRTNYIGVLKDFGRYIPRNY